MAIIYCTKKLEKIVGKKLITKSAEPSSLGNWNANIFYVNKKKCIIMMNDVSYYSLLFINIQKKDLLNFHDVFIECFLKQLDNDNINFPYQFTPKIINELRPHFLRTNNNRKVLGTMNEATQTAEYFIYNDYLNNIDNINVNELNTRINDNIVSVLGTSRRGYGEPNKAMQEVINKACN